MGNLGGYEDETAGRPAGGAAGGAGLLPAVKGGKGKGGAGEKPKGGDRENPLLAAVAAVTTRLAEQAKDEAQGGRVASRRQGRVSASLQGATDEGKELTKELCAASIHNVSLKRAALGPGILTCLLSLTRGCKSIRVLHCVRTMANVSRNMKAKMSLAKVRRALFTPRRALFTPRRALFPPR